MLFKRLIINGDEYPLAVNQSGVGLPTAQTEGSIGGLYMDTGTRKLYKCTRTENHEFVWEPVGEEILEDGSRSLGATPLTTERAGHLRLESPVTCSYTIQAPTVGDWKGQFTFYDATFAQKDGFLEFHASESATAWYSCFAELLLEGLTPGMQYRLIVDAEGCDWDLNNSVTNGCCGVYEKNGDYMAAMSSIEPPGNNLVFTATAQEVKVRIYPSASAHFAAGESVARIRDVYVNLADGGFQHTQKMDIQGYFSGTEEREEWIPAGSVIRAEPDCQVYLLPENREPISHLAGKTCVCFGDWVTACKAAPEDYPSILAKRTGMTVINAAIGPGRMASKSEQDLEPFCMFSLAQAAATGDWSAQDEWIGGMYSDPYAAERLEKLKQVDWSKVAFVTIAHGGNDYADSVSLYEFRMALYYSVDKLLTAWPHLKIMLLTPVWCWWPGEIQDGETKSINSNTLLSFRTEIMDAGSRYRIPVLDLLKTLGFNSLTKGHYFPENEGRDPNTLGQIAIGNKLAARMLAEFW